MLLLRSGGGFRSLAVAILRKAECPISLPDAHLCGRMAGGGGEDGGETPLPRNAGVAIDDAMEAPGPGDTGVTVETAGGW